MDAIDPAYDAEDDFELVDELNKVSKTAIPKAIEEIRTAPVLHDTVCETCSNGRRSEEDSWNLMNQKKQPMEENGLLFYAKNVMINQDRE